MTLYRLILMACLGLTLGCGGQSLTLSGGGEVSIVVQTSGSTMDKTFIKDAFKIMEDACKVRGWKLFRNPVPMALPSTEKNDEPLKPSARTDSASIIAETVERVFRWFPSQAVTLSGCCVHPKDRDKVEKACPAPTKKSESAKLPKKPESIRVASPGPS